MQDRRHDIIQAGIATLREHGYSGFTQPKVASRAGLRQSHLTYYYPTRVDLLVAVGRAAIEGQLAAVDAVLTQASLETVAAAIAKVAVRHETTRVIMALAQAADQEPPLRALFLELADGIVSRAHFFLKAHNPAATEADARLLHALSVGLAVVDLATGREDGESRAESILYSALSTISQRSGP
ncbi:MAG: TetR family transcriptional regulator [Rhizobiaceae bacterium]|nr:TetR family transcriptional regulator [Rhizobiaceae bacterium]